MIPKSIIRTLRENALSTAKQGDSTIIIFKPSVVGIATMTSEYGVARIIDFEGWAYPVESMEAAKKLVASMLGDGVAN